MPRPIGHIRASDAIAWIAVTRDLTDHAMFVDSQPVKKRSCAPFAEGTVQWD